MGFKIVFRQDQKATRKLGKDYLRTCEVEDWETRGKGRYQCSFPRSWRVPAEVLAEKEITPIGREEADERRERRSLASEQAYRKRQEENSGLTRTQLAIKSGEISPEYGAVIAFKAKYRHDFTDYDSLLASGEDRESARELAIEQPIPSDWEGYREKYGFYGETAKALCRVLKDPKKCHPIWFFEAEIAVRKFGLDLGSLTYESICDAVSMFRAECQGDR